MGGELHSVYVCDSCEISCWHPTTYCNRCPGRMTQVRMTIEQVAATYRRREDDWMHYNSLEHRESDSIRSRKVIPCTLRWFTTCYLEYSADGNHDIAAFVARIVRETGFDIVLINPVGGNGYTFSVSLWFPTFTEARAYYDGERFRKLAMRERAAIIPDDPQYRRK